MIETLEDTPSVITKQKLGYIEIINRMYRKALLDVPAKVRFWLSLKKKNAEKKKRGFKKIFLAFGGHSLCSGYNQWILATEIQKTPVALNKLKSKVNQQTTQKTLFLKIYLFLLKNGLG